MPGLFIVNQSVEETKMSKATSLEAKPVLSSKPNSKLDLLASVESRDSNYLDNKYSSNIDQEQEFTLLAIQEALSIKAPS